MDKSEKNYDVIVIGGGVAGFAHTRFLPAALLLYP